MDLDLEIELCDSSRQLQINVLLLFVFRSPGIITVIARLNAIVISTKKHPAEGGFRCILSRL